MGVSRVACGRRLASRSRKRRTRPSARCLQGSGDEGPRRLRGKEEEEAESEDCVVATASARRRPVGVGPTSMVRPARPTEQRYGAAACEAWAVLLVF